MAKKQSLSVPDVVSRVIAQKSASWKIGASMSTTAWLQVRAQLLLLGEGIHI